MWCHNSYRKRCNSFTSYKGSCFTILTRSSCNIKELTFLFYFSFYDLLSY
uniref:Uncharacterized protein n=1 Tax=Medicago truncatula TaxID=3880 RepID=I3SCP7_MEDTR|nr:unknown [Medicago truncatula]